MSNYFNYVKHALFDPSYYQRRFEHDLPDSQSNYTEAAKRVALIALPFLSLYKPFGQGLSVCMGSCRCVSHLSATGMSLYKKDIYSFANNFMMTALAVGSLAGTFFHFQVGMLATTAVDMALALKKAIQYVLNGEYEKAIDELLQAISSCLYLLIMVNGSLEISLASILLQGIISLYQARAEWKAGRTPECAAKFAMGMIRFYQGHQQLELIQKRNLFLTLQKFSNLMQQVQKGRDAAHLVDSPLNEHEHDVILLDAEGKPYNFGTHMHGYGDGTVKGMNLQFRTRVVDGKTMTQIEFKVNHVFRDSLEALVKGMKDFSPGELHQFLSLTQSHAQGIKIEEVPFVLSEETNQTIGNAYKITLDGLGSVWIGNSRDYPNLYDRVRVEISEEKNLFECHELLSFFNLEAALHSSSQGDIERLKLGQLFRIFHPTEATVLERDPQFFNLSLEQLKEEMIRRAPAARDQIERYLPTMQAVETLPGRIRYTIPDLADMVYDAGGRALISTITGPESEVMKRLASILKMGMISSELRYSNGMTVSGLSSSADFTTGGADSVFTQLITERNVSERLSLDNFYWGKVRILFSLDVFTTGTYQYHYDSYGSRIVPEGPSGTPYYAGTEYPYRPEVLGFVSEEQREFHRGNEVMIKEYIPTSMITGIVVDDVSTRTSVLEELSRCGLVTRDSDGIQKILGIAVDRFIHVGQDVSADMVV